MLLNTSSGSTIISGIYSLAAGLKNAYTANLLQIASRQQIYPGNAHFVISLSLFFFILREIFKHCQKLILLYRINGASLSLIRLTLLLNYANPHEINKQDLDLNENNFIWIIGDLKSNVALYSIQISELPIELSWVTGAKIF